MKDKIPYLMAIMAILAASWGAWQYLDRFALADDVKSEIKKIAQRQDRTDTLFEIQKESDKVYRMDQRIWQIKSQSGEKPKDPSAKQEIENLEKQKEISQKKIETLEKK